MGQGPLPRARPSQPRPPKGLGFRVSGLGTGVTGCYGFNPNRQAVSNSGIINNIKIIAVVAVNTIITIMLLLLRLSILLLRLVLATIV